MGGLGEAISIKLHDEWLARMEVQGRRFRAYAVDVAD
jgi:acetoacetyl-CoA reductase